jgi:hypothetical protein
MRTAVIIYLLLATDFVENLDPVIGKVFNPWFGLSSSVLLHR